MTHLIGLLSQDEITELKKRGWEIKDPPKELGFKTPSGSNEVNKMVTVNGKMFDIMSGPNWECNEKEVISEKTKLKKAMIEIEKRSQEKLQEVIGMPLTQTLLRQIKAHVVEIAKSYDSANNFSLLQHFEVKIEALLVSRDINIQLIPISSVAREVMEEWEPV